MAILAPRPLTYSDLDRESDQIADRIVKTLGDSSPIPVGFLFKQGPTQLIVTLAILKSGHIAVPLDSAFPHARLNFMIRDSKSQMLITDTENTQLAQSLVGSKLTLLNIDEIDRSAEPPKHNPALSSESPSHLLYTSGSTGKPKGVIQTHQNILQMVWSASHSYKVTHEDRVALLFSCGFAASLTPMFLALLNGATSCPFNVKDDLLSLPDWLIDKQISIYMSVPTIFRHVARSLGKRDQKAPMRMIILGGEPVLRQDIDLYKRFLPDECQLNVRLAGTEMLRLRSFPIHKSTQLAGNIVPVGFHVDDKQVLLLNDEGDEVPTGEIGEITVISSYLSPGYWNQPELTQAAFQDKGDNTGERIYRTGDLGRLSETGCLEHLGRKDFLVKIRGNRVELGEIESAILDLPTVDATATRAITSAERGTYIAAYVVMKSGEEFNMNRLRAHIASTLPDYMIPAYIVQLETLPLTATGKVNRKLLPDPEPDKSAVSSDYIPPETALEVELHKIWIDVLKVKRLGINDDFYAMGGDSLLAARVLDSLQKQKNISLPMSAMSAYPTIKTMAQAMESKGGIKPDRAVVALQSGGDRPTFFCVPGAGNIVDGLRYLAQHLGEDQPFFGFQYRGMNGVGEPFTRVQDMAAFFISEMRQVQPKGPYYLGGSSFGGLVAFEMAQQLIKSNEEIALLAFLDSYAPGYPRARYQQKVGTKLLRLLYHFLLPVGERGRFAWKRVRAGLRQRYFRISARIVTKVCKKMNRPLPRRYRFFRGLTLARKAIKTYPIAPYHHPIHLFRAEIQPSASFHYPDPTLGWKDWALGGLHILDIPGQHGDQVKEPTVLVVCEHLRQIIDRSLEQNPAD